MNKNFFFFFQAEDGIRYADVTGVQTCALPIWIEARAEASLHVSRGSLAERRQSELERVATHRRVARGARQRLHRQLGRRKVGVPGPQVDEIGRASCRERV